MPIKAKRSCTYPGCGNLVASGRCDLHRPTANKQSAQYDKQRGTAHQRGYTSKWAKYSKEYRKRNPLCVDCLKEGKLTSVEHGGHVDHIVAVTGPDDPNFWLESNHASRCHSCHSRKTAREDGGMGNKPIGKVGKECGADGMPSDKRHHWR